MFGPMPKTSIIPTLETLVTNGYELFHYYDLTHYQTVKGYFMSNEYPIYFAGRLRSDNTLDLLMFSTSNLAIAYESKPSWSPYYPVFEHTFANSDYYAQYGLYFAMAGNISNLAPYVEVFPSIIEAAAAISKYVQWNGDPYYPVGATTSGGGPFHPNPPDYDPTDSDDVDFGTLPEVSAVGTGFVSLWSPTEQQMLDLSEYMWNADVLTLNFWKRLIADPLQLIYGLNIIPVDLDAAGIVGSSPESVVVGTINTGIKMNYLTSQWVEVDCGQLTIDECMLGSYMDYDPYTKLDIYLPYIGYRPLKVDDFMPGTISVKYKIDLLTGACVAQIKSTKSNLHDDELDSVVYQFIGNCATQVPVTASQYADAVRSAISTAAAIGSVVALAGTGGAAIGASAGAQIMPTASTALTVPQTGLVPAESGLGMADMAFGVQMAHLDASKAVSAGTNTLKQVGMLHSGASAAQNAMGLKPSIGRSGAIGGAAGMLATQTPYLIFTRPRVAHPEEQNKYMGYPSFMTRTLGSLTGFTQVQAIHLEGIPCTTSELAEIESLLEGGVIF